MRQARIKGSAMKNVFDATFKCWGITFPKEILSKRQSGFICRRGWLIQYCFGSDKRGEFLDYYAAHRMTEDSHRRIYSDGSGLSLPSYISFRAASDEPKEDARLAKEFYRKNQKVTQQLIQKGFTKFTMDMYLKSEPVKDEKN